MEPRSIKRTHRLRTWCALALLPLLLGCYSDMQYGIEEPDADEADAQWWCTYRNSCEKKEADTWW